jgi:hypothetical protein
MEPLATPILRDSRFRFGIYLLDAAALGPAWFGYLKFTGAIVVPGVFHLGAPIMAGRGTFCAAILASCLASALLYRKIVRGPRSAIAAGLFMPFVGGISFGALCASHRWLLGYSSSLIDSVLTGAFEGGLYPFQDPRTFLVGVAAVAVLYPLARWCQGLHLWRPKGDAAQPLPAGP